MSDWTVNYTLFESSIIRVTHPTTTRSNESHQKVQNKKYNNNYTNFHLYIDTETDLNQKIFLASIHNC